LNAPFCGLERFSSLRLGRAKLVGSQYEMNVDPAEIGLLRKTHVEWVQIWTLAEGHEAVPPGIISLTFVKCCALYAKEVSRITLIHALEEFDLFGKISVWVEEPLSQQVPITSCIQRLVRTTLAVADRG
jgi:hypothetical protein